jgi:hypothetical protein
LVSPNPQFEPFTSTDQSPNCEAIYYKTTSYSEYSTESYQLSQLWQPWLLYALFLFLCTVLCILDLKQEYYICSEVVNASLKHYSILYKISLELSSNFQSSLKLLNLLKSRDNFSVINKVVALKFNLKHVMLWKRKDDTNTSLQSSGIIRKII